MRVRDRALLTLDCAKRARKNLVEKLAASMINKTGQTCVSFNLWDNWIDVGRYRVLNEILHEIDK